MTRKRSEKRKKKRLKVYFGLDYPERVAFTVDISHDGLFIATRRPERKGKYLVLRILLPDGKEAAAYGEVQWTRKSSPEISGTEKRGGMAVRLTGFEFGEEEYRDLLNEREMSGKA